MVAQNMRYAKHKKSYLEVVKSIIKWESITDTEKWIII